MKVKFMREEVHISTWCIDIPDEIANSDDECAVYEYASDYAGMYEEDSLMFDHYTDWEDIQVVE